MTKIKGVLLFIFVTDSLFSQNVDIDILKSINSPQTKPSDNFFKLVSNTDNYLVVGMTGCIGLAGLVNHNKEMFRNACVMVGANALNTAVTYGLKYSINRKRPFETYSFITKKSDGGTPSFPSGETSSAFATATSLSLAYPKWYVIAPSYLWASTVGYSRMYLGVHYPSDVLGGMIVGSGSAFLTYKANNWLKKRYAKKHEN
jgi:membrane-associated phospholipid phosphatase